MSFYINLDENSINSYYFEAQVSTPYSSLANLIVNSYLKASTNQFDQCAAAIANGTIDFGWNGSEMAQKMKGHVLKNAFIPIGMNYSFSYQGTVSFNEFVNTTANFKKPVLNDSPYPIAVRYIDQNGNYYIERPPFQTKVDFNISGRSKVYNSVSIWIPWSITVLNPELPSGCKVYFSNQQLSDENTMYVPSLLPNTYQDGSICFGNSLVNINDFFDDEKDVRQVYSAVFNEYMSGGWNMDLYPNILSFDYLFHKNEILKKFINISQDDFMKQYPRMTKKVVDDLLFYRLSNGYSRLESFKYMFYAMGTMNLEETLDFYQAVIEESVQSQHPNNVKSFSKILDDTIYKDNSYNLLVSKLFKYCKPSVLVSEENFFTISVIYTNYENVFIDNDSNKTLKDSNKSYGPLNANAQMNNPYVYGKLFEFFEFSKLNKPGVGMQYVHVLDVENNVCTRHLINIKDAKEFYYTYLQENHCSPLGNNEAQKVNVQL
jgi:hypothetical protein